MVHGLYWLVVNLAAEGRLASPRKTASRAMNCARLCLHITGDVAVEEGTFRGTHHGVLHTPAGDIPPTGRPVTVGYIQVLRFRDGQHVSFSLLFDRLLMLEQLGLVPAPAATS